MPSTIPPDKTTPSQAPVVVGIGEVLWDVFADKALFGGAPANFACHAAALGAHAFIVSCVGLDAWGDRALETLQHHGVGVRAIARDAEALTGVVQVSLDGQGHPKYTIQQDVAWDRIPYTPETGDLAARTDAVCFGSLAQRDPVSRQTIHRFLARTPSSCIRVFDVNLRQHYYSKTVIEESLQRCTVLKLNDEELPVVSEMLALHGITREQHLESLIQLFNLRLAVLTLGAHGALLLSRKEQVLVPAATVEVRDTVGAGDAFTAAVVMGLLSGKDLHSIAKHASAVAGYVCSQHGAVPALPDDLRNWPGSETCC